jgi:hypothetical protein
MSLDDVIIDREAPLEWTLELAALDPVSGSLVTLWLSTAPRVTSDTDTPAGIRFLLGLRPGSISEVLSADVLYAGSGDLGRRTVRAEVDRDETGAGTLDSWRSLRFAGQRAVLRFGALSAPHSEFAVRWTGIVEREPAIDALGLGDTWEWSVYSITDRLAETVRHQRLVGVHTGARGDGVYTLEAPHHVAYERTSFTVAGRFRFAPLLVGSAVAPVLLEHQTVGTNRQMFVTLGAGSGASAGRVRVQVSIGGVSVLLHESPTRYDDSADHWYGWALRDKIRSSLVIDGNEVSVTVPSGSVPTAVAAPVKMLRTSLGLQSDVRIYGRPLDLAELRAEMATADADGHQDLVAWWRLDDGLGNTAADSSPTNNAATAVGGNAIWEPTDLGGPELAGQPVPIVFGSPRHAPALRVDPLRDRYRHADAATNPLIPSIRGQALPGTDYTQPAPGVIAFVNTPADPVSVEYQFPPYPAGWPRVRGLVEGLLARKGPRSPSLHSGAGPVLDWLAPFRAGVAYTDPPLLRDALSAVLGSLGLHYREGRTGELVVGTLSPPLLPGPWDPWAAVVEFLGWPTSGVTLPGVFSGSSSSHTVAWWIRPQALTEDPQWGSVLVLPPEGPRFVDCRAGAGGFALGVNRVPGSSIGAPFWEQTGAFDSTGAEALTGDDVLVPNVWQMLVGVYDAGGAKPTRQLWVVTLGGGARPVTKPVEVVTGGSSASGASLTLGANWLGGMGRGIVWPRALAEAEIVALATAAPAAPFTLDVPLSEGIGAAVKPVTPTGTAGGTLAGFRWAPRLRIDLDLRGDVQFVPGRPLVPAWRTEVRYGRNYRPLSDQDVVGSVPYARRLFLTTPYRVVADDRPEIRDLEPAAREVLLDTPLLRRRDAAAVLAGMLRRFASGRSAAEVHGLNRDGLLLEPCDELVVLETAGRWGLPASYRVTGISADYDAMAHSVNLWR